MDIALWAKNCAAVARWNLQIASHTSANALKLDWLWNYKTVIRSEKFFQDDVAKSILELHIFRQQMRLKNTEQIWAKVSTCFKSISIFFIIQKNLWNGRSSVDFALVKQIRIGSHTYTV